LEEGGTFRRRTTEVASSLSVAQNAGWSPRFHASGVTHRFCDARVRGRVSIHSLACGPDDGPGQSEKGTCISRNHSARWDGATSNGSKPFCQWCVVRTPIISVAPSSVRRAVVNRWRKPTDSVWKSAFDCAAWPLLAAQKASSK
jgi:hypothetical protein